MRLSLFRIILLGIGALVAVSFLGGSAFWAMLGLHKDLNIDGEASVVREAPGSIGDGWASYGGDKAGNRFSNADQINLDNVDTLEIAWTLNTGALEGRDVAHGRSAFQTTPILVEDKLVFCTQFNEVIAADPATGEELWRYNPEVALDRHPGNQYTCRGVSYWSSSTGSDGLCASRLFMGTVDARLIALDTQTGQKCSDFGEAGEVTIEPSLQLRWPGEFQITSAPAIIGNTVVTGTSISDNLRTQAPFGTVHAYDVRTGEEKWSFNPVPQDENDPAMATWAPGSTSRVGHANVWSTMSVDEARGLVIMPTSTASPDYYGGHRKGDNLYSDSVVALDGETGEVVWHFQTVHHDVWDYDLPSQPGLHQVWKDGQAHDVVVQATKTGLVFVLDRDTGKPFLPVEERPVPQGGVEGEHLSATQPFPVLTPPLVRSELDPNDAFGITLWDKLACKSQLKSLRAEGLYTPPSEQGTLAYPFTGGGANWGSGAYDPSRNLYIINMSNAGSYIYVQREKGEGATADKIDEGTEFAPMEGVPYTMQRGLIASPLGLPCTPPPWGVLAAVDVSTGEIVWRKTHGTTEDLAGGIALKFGTPTFGGPIITKTGLIFIAGAMDDYLRAFDVSTGKELWKGRLPAGGQATPMTYTHEGRQYVVIAAGGHARVGTKLGDAVVAFSLP